MNKKVLKKLLVSLIIVVFMTNIFVNNIVLADTAETGFFDVLGDFLGVALGSVVGLLTYPFRLLALALADGLDGITAGLAYSQGTINEHGVIDPYGSASSITPFDIFFNKIAIVDVNFFNIPSGESIVRNMRVAIASWYYVMRNIAASILLCVLIYVGIRMAISTVASDKAAYKKMLVDWVCSLALIFLVQYIMIFTFAVNEALINALKAVGEKNATDIINAMEAIKRTATNLVTLDSIAATIVYCMLVGQTLGLLFSYFNRMLKIAFLVIISPLITLTYSMDKMGDGKAQALGTWLKEFVYTVLIQVFHCIIYMVFIGMAVSVLNSGVLESYNLVGSFLAVMCVKFTKDAEKLLGKIFKFGDSTSDASIAAGMALSAAAFQNAGKIGKGTVKAVNGVRSLKNNMGDFWHKAKVSKAALAAVWAAKKDDKDLTYEQAREEAEASVIKKEAEKTQKKNEKKYGVRSDTKEYEDKVKAAEAKLRDENPQLSDNMVAAKARAQVAAETRSAGKASKRPEIIKKVSGKIKPWREMAKEVRSSDVYKEISKGVKAYASTGVALFAGATMYGMNGDAFKAFAIGGTAFKGSQEVLKNSSTTLVDDANTILDSLGAKDKDGVAREMQKTHEMAPILSDNNELDKYLDNLLKFVDAQLSAEGVDPQGSDAKAIKSNIKNTVAQQIKKNPNIEAKDLQKLVASNLQNCDASEANINKVIGDGGFNSAIDNVANARRRKELYDVMQNANDLNLTPETFTKMVQGRYSSSSEGDFKTNEEIMRDKSHVLQPEELEERTERKIEELEEYYQDRFDQAVDAMDQEKLEPHQIDALVREQELCATNMRTINDREAQGISESYKKQYEDLAQKLANEGKEEARKEIQQAINDLRKEFEAKLKDYQAAYPILLSDRDESRAAYGIKKQPIRHATDETLEDMKTFLDSIPEYK